MPKRTDIHSIMIIGAGPIIIGQACEFDYSGAQACKALKEEGYRVILVNSNPATIMTDPGLADATYIEPITPEMVARVIDKEKPDALLPTMGGQTALNTAIALSKDGTLDRHGVELIGAKLEAIEKAEDRLLFRDAMDKIGLESPRSSLVHSVEEAMDALAHVGLPAIMRPSFTLGGEGGGVAYNAEEYAQIIRNALRASPVSSVLVEESVLGWKEYEMEVVRDKADNCIIICSIENVDPMGVHTGDHHRCPCFTLTDKEYQRMRMPPCGIARDRCRNWRLKRSVRSQSGEWSAHHHRDEPVFLAPPLSLRRQPVSQSQRSRPSWRSVICWTNSAMTLPVARRLRASSRPLTMSSPRSRVLRLKNSRTQSRC